MAIIDVNLNARIVCNYNSVDIYGRNVFNNSYTVHAWFPDHMIRRKTFYSIEACENWVIEKQSEILDSFGYLPEIDLCIVDRG